jgi:iron complex transport system ATP-binding protein
MGYIEEKESYRIILIKMMENTTLSVRSLRIGYTSGKRTFSIMPEFDASACPGELIAVIGRNGVGKSTLLRTLTGLQPALGGNIIISGKNISDYSKMELARKTGYISTEAVRVINMSVYDLVSLGRFPHTNWIGYLDRESRDAISLAILKSGLEGFEFRPVSELSDGERQRAMIARVLAQDAEIMIMDEPTAFLDIAGRYEIIKLAQELAKSGKTIIYSTHDLNPALTTADKIWLLLKDRLIEGYPEELIRNGSINRLFESTSFTFDPETRRPVNKDEKSDYLKYFL